MSPCSAQAYQVSPGADGRRGQVVHGARGDRVRKLRQLEQPLDDLVEVAEIQAGDRGNPNGGQAAVEVEETLFALRREMAEAVDLVRQADECGAELSPAPSVAVSTIAIERRFRPAR